MARRSTLLYEVDEDTRRAALVAATLQFEAERARRPVLPTEPTITPEEAEALRHPSLLESTLRFYPGYQVGKLHEVMATEIQAALSQRVLCPVCDGSGIGAQAVAGVDLPGVPRNPCKQCQGAGDIPDPSPYWLAMFVPPQHGKSELVSIQAPPWYLAQHPTHNWVDASYASSLAERNSRYARDIIESADYNVLYGLRPSRSTSSVKEWTLQGYRGGMKAIGLEGGLTGRRADVLVIDDPVKDAAAARSDLIRESTHAWWRTVARTRLQPHAIVILVMTRWHHDDLAGRLLKADKESGRNRWRVVRIPARADSPDDPLGREFGQVIWPERFPTPASAEQFYDDLEVDMGPVDWAAIGQQTPTMGENALIKPEYWGYYDPHTDLPPANMPNRGFLYIVQLWDTAFKDKSRNDFNACVTFGVAGNGIYILEVYNRRHELPALLAAATSQAEKWGPTHLKVENKASGPSMAQMLKVAAKRVYVELWDPPDGGDKYARMAAIVPMVSSGQVKIPHCTCGIDQVASPPWLNAFLEQLYGFPAWANDDMADSFSGGLQVVKDLTDGHRRARAASTYGDAAGTIPERYVDRDTNQAPSPAMVARRGQR